MTKLPITRSKNRATWISGALFIVVFLVHKPDYLNTSDLYFWLGIIALPFTYKISREVKSTRFFWPGAGCGLVSVFFPTTFLIYCATVFCVLFVIEQFEGKCNWLFVLHLLLLSPIFQYVESIVS